MTSENATRDERARRSRQGQASTLSIEANHAFNTGKRSNDLPDLAEAAGYYGLGRGARVWARQRENNPFYCFAFNVYARRTNPANPPNPSNPWPAVQYKRQS